MLHLHPMRLLPGQDLKKSLNQYVQTHQLQAAFVLAAVGSFTQVHLRFADQAAGRLMQGHFELVSLSGTLSVAGMHLHMSVSDDYGVTTGGHLLDDNLVYTTAELVLGESTDHVFLRESDGTTAWPELQIRLRGQ